MRWRSSSARCGRSASARRSPSTIRWTSGSTRPDAGSPEVAWTSPLPRECCGRPCRSLAKPFALVYFSPPLQVPLAHRCRSSVVEHSLGMGEVLSSILSGSTIKTRGKPRVLTLLGGADASARPASLDGCGQRLKSAEPRPPAPHRRAVQPVVGKAMYEARDRDPAVQTRQGPAHALMVAGTEREMAVWRP